MDCVCGLPPIGVPTMPEPSGTVVGGTSPVVGVVGALPPSSDWETGLFTGSVAAAGSSVDGGAGTAVAGGGLGSEGATVGVGMTAVTGVDGSAVVVTGAGAAPSGAVVGAAPSSAVVGAATVVPVPVPTPVPRVIDGT